MVHVADSKCDADFDFFLIRRMSVEVRPDGLICCGSIASCRRERLDVALIDRSDCIIYHA
jgi:hypothetical protein